MDNATRTRILSGLTEAAAQVHITSKRLGNWPTNKERNAMDVLALIRAKVDKTKLAMLSGEVPSHVIEGHTNVDEELADLIIIVLDFCRGNEVSIASAVLDKMLYNEALSRLI